MQLFKNRRTALIEHVKSYYNVQEGSILLFAGFEQPRHTFIQDSSFYYYTGIQEPGLVLLLDFNNKATIFVPCFLTKRSDWVMTEHNFEDYLIDKVEYLGEGQDGYSVQPYFKKEQYSNLINILALQHKIFTIAPLHPRQYAMQLYLLEHLSLFISDFYTKIFDISLLIARMRQVKDAYEIRQIQSAIDITLQAHKKIKEIIHPGVNEAELYATINYIYNINYASEAFPSIVATGVNSTILHYTDNNAILKENQTLVVDIGAIHKHYCADITRTYSTSGHFTAQQEKIYNLVYDAQQYVARCAKPGYWLNNPRNPDKSLHHIAKNFFLEKGGYDQYFIHSLGHYLGLDVHDVGDYSQPLQVGEVFTIEPGLYFREQEIGVRIEDDYIVTETGVDCLSKE